MKEIIIGREQTNGMYVVDDKYQSVSRIHAKIVRDGTDYVIEDLDSSNGTFVNGLRVKSRRLRRVDKVYLGGSDYYRLDVSAVIQMFPMTDVEYKARVLQLEKVYRDFIQQKSKLELKGQESMMTKRMMPTMMLGTLTAMVTVLVDDSLKVAIGVAGGLLSIGVFIVATKWASKSSQEMKDNLQTLNEDFELNYVCPACGCSFRGKSWRALQQEGKCMRCNRPFK